MLRFNFRGVEGSEGSSTTGTEEPADAHGAVDLMRERFPESPIAIAGLPAPGEIEIGVPLLVVVGANDEHTRPQGFKAWAAGVGARYKEIPAANHFFWAKYEPLIDAVARFLEEVV